MLPVVQSCCRITRSRSIATSKLTTIGQNGRACLCAASPCQGTLCRSTLTTAVATVTTLFCKPQVTSIITMALKNLSHVFWQPNGIGDIMACLQGLPYPANAHPACLHWLTLRSYVHARCWLLQSILPASTTCTQMTVADIACHTGQQGPSSFTHPQRCRVPSLPIVIAVLLS